MQKLGALSMGLLVAVISGVGCSHQIQSAADSDGYKSIGNARFNFFVNIPIGWRAEDRSANGDGYFLLSGDEGVDLRVYGGHRMSDFDLFEEMPKEPGCEAATFKFADGREGMRLSTKGELYYIRTEEDVRIVLYAGARADWLDDNRATLEKIAASIRPGESP